MLHTPPPKVFYYRDFKNINYTKLESAIDSINRKLIFNMSCVDDQMIFLQNNLTDFKDRPWFKKKNKDLISKRQTSFFALEAFLNVRAPQLLQKFTK